MTPTTKSVAFVIPSLRAGGAERVMSFIADNLNKDKFTTTLIIIESKKDQAYNIKNIDVIFLNKKRVRNAFFEIFKLIYKNKYDLVISSLAHVNIMMASFAMILKKTKFITRETYVKGARFGNKENTFFEKVADKIQKSNIRKIICQSQDMFDSLSKNYNYNKEQLVIINNPITIEYPPKSRINSNKANKYITIGRLAKQKGYPRILNILSKLEYEFHYTIIGSGTEKETIFELIDELNLSDKISYIPFTKDVHKYLSENDIYLQGSYYEGFPNTLLETCSVGTPVIAFNAPGGINEIIQDGVNGYRVNTENEFIDKLEALRNEMPNPETVNKSVMSRYNKNLILEKYDNLFCEVLLS